MTDRPAPFWPRGLREEWAAEYVGLSVATFRREVAEHRAPAPVRLTPGRQVWLKQDLDGWLDQKACRVPASAAQNPWMARVNGTR
jgi:predicted DNA-binding transcriptional regulator AlpA